MTTEKNGVPEAPKELKDWARLRLRTAISVIANPHLAVLCARSIQSPGFQEQVGSATVAHHHAYIGGLLVHTAEVTDYAYNMIDMFPNCDWDAVLTAAILHDWGKIHEYEIVNGEIRKTDYRRLIRHVAGSYAMVEQELSYYLDVPRETKLKIGHAILAHHGRQEWGSPMEPQNVEAFILHTADMFSAHYGATRFLTPEN